MVFSPTRFFLVLSLALLGLALGATASAFFAIAWGLATALLVVAAAADLLLLPGRHSLSARRELPGEVGVGVPFPMTLTLIAHGNPRMTGVLWDAAPDAAEGKREPVALSTDADGSMSIQRDYCLNERGAAHFDNPAFVVTGPLRLMRRLLRPEARARVLAIPGVEVLRQNRLVLAAMSDAAVGVNRSRGVGRGGEFASLAPYVPGDPPQAVDWKAYARSGTLAVRRFEPERRRYLMLCCDAGRLMGGRVGGKRKVDLALASFARLAAAALQRGDLVGLLIFDDAVRVMIPPRNTPGHLARMVRSTLNVAPSHSETAYTPAFVAVNTFLSRRSLVVLATDFDNAAQGWELRRNIAALRRRHVVVVCGMRDPVYREAIEAEIVSDDDAWRQLASLTLLEERAGIYRSIHSGGVRTIDAEPGDLTGPLLNTYGELVNSGRL